MKRFPALSSERVIAALLKAGFTYAPRRSRGGHVAVYYADEEGRRVLVVVPRSYELPRGMLRSILMQANLTKEDFLRHLEETGS
ncbi:type II toxin-antitoxin system HicA family toxin [Methanofollis fontis]|uniref:Type II toxin-antitoxin system HicA family toxin n=1 Tax=Methanofollis fontis TaxID=2052832 RepID=A0A483CUH9_9EURY|nr:type II toxin-antitoxin system HicA family toxin [Methanofollis fontis]TAJ44567.1 hypothetical protein CUJ86_04455 [Methanofollis fontis]